MNESLNSSKAENVPPVDRDEGVIRLRMASQRIFLALLICALGLVAAGIASSILKFELGFRSGFGFIPLFDLDREGNVPTWFSSILLFSIAVLLGLISAAKFKLRDRWRWHWGALAIIFFLFSLDEAASFHERTTEPLRNALDLSGVLYFAWVVPAAILLIAFAVIYVRFVFALPRRTRHLFVGAACLYVGGALGVELAGGAYVSAYGNDFLAYGLIAICEESLEMLGLVTFFYGLSEYMSSQSWELRLVFDP